MRHSASLISDNGASVKALIGAEAIVVAQNRVRRYAAVGRKQWQPVGSLLRQNQRMPKTVKVRPRRKGQRTPARDPLVGVRLPRAVISRIDRWAKSHGHEVSRPQAIRQLIAIALAGVQPSRSLDPIAAARAADMAGQQIDKLADVSATNEQRRQRKRRLLKGPREFRDIRGWKGSQR